MSDAKTEYQVDYRIKFNGDNYEAGKKIKLSQKDAEPLLGTNPPAISIPGKNEDETPAGNNVVTLNGGDKKPEPSDSEVRLNFIKAAIIGLDKDDKTKWTAGGAPDANVLTELLGWKVSADERNQAWMELQEEENKDKEDQD